MSASDTNNLKLSYPNLCQQWNYTANGELLPENFTPKSNKRVWWFLFNGSTRKVRIQDMVRSYIRKNM